MSGLPTRLRALAEHWDSEAQKGAERARGYQFSTAEHMPGPYDAGLRWGQRKAYEHAAELAEEWQAQFITEFGRAVTEVTAGIDWSDPAARSDAVGALMDRLGIDLVPATVAIREA